MFLHGDPALRRDQPQSKAQAGNRSLTVLHCYITGTCFEEFPFISRATGKLHTLRGLVWNFPSTTLRWYTKVQ